MPVIHELHMDYIVDYLNSNKNRISRNNDFIRDDGKYKDDDYGLKKQKEEKSQKINTLTIKEIRVKDTPTLRKEKFLKIEKNIIDRCLSVSTNMQSSFGCGIFLNS